MPTFRSEEDIEEQRTLHTATGQYVPPEGGGLEAPPGVESKPAAPIKGDKPPKPTDPPYETPTGGGGGGGGFGFKPEPFKWRLMPAHLVGKELQTRQFVELYVAIWGVAPPKGYLKALRKKGFNLYEMYEHERSKKAFKHTRFYRQQKAEAVAQAASILGFQ